MLFICCSSLYPVPVVAPVPYLLLFKVLLLVDLAQTHLALLLVQRHALLELKCRLLRLHLPLYVIKRLIWRKKMNLNKNILILT